MAVVCSGFSYDMEVVSHGFVTDISKTEQTTAIARFTPMWRASRTRSRSVAPM